MRIAFTMTAKTLLAVLLLAPLCSAAVAGVPAAAAPAAAPAAAAPANTGDRIDVSGIVTDPQGKPLPGLRVVLEATRSYFSLRELHRAEAESHRVSATTDERGGYALSWPRDSYYNTFELQVGLPVRRGAGERLEVLARQDLTQRVQKGGAIVSALVIKDPGRIDRLRQFVSSLSSTDQRKVYDEMGNPDQVKLVRYPDREEASWWYFESGRMYRFRDGALEQVVPFDPVKPF